MDEKKDQGLINGDYKIKFFGTSLPCIKEAYKKFFLLVLKIVMSGIHRYFVSNWYR